MAPPSDYERAQKPFPAGIAHFDIHVYFDADDSSSVAEAMALRQLLTQTYPNLPAFPPVHRAIGPHSKAMYELHVLTPLDFGHVVPWLTQHHGNLSVLIHPNTASPLRDHTVNAIWIGQPLPIRKEIFG